MTDSIRRRLFEAERRLPPRREPPCVEPLPTAEYLAKVVDASIESGVWIDAVLAARVAALAERGEPVDFETVAAVWQACSGMSERERAARARAAAALDL